MIKNTRQCPFCTSGVRYIDYKDLDTLRRFTDPYAKIVKKKKSSVCAGHQRSLAESIKRARFLALLPFVAR